jgi:hypothetical protein
MNNKKNSPLLARLWQYQQERAPLPAIVTMAALTVGVIYHFSNASIYRYLASAVIVVLYLIQIRASDEKKDFEHDNKFYKNRPVQRGLVTLDELQMVGKFAIATQLIIYASFQEVDIFILGLLSQGYAFLTRKEFYARVWLRKRLLTYNFLHQIQLIILFFVVLNIIKPTELGYVQLLLFMLINIATVELARKTLPKSKDVAKDSYSSRLGYKGDAAALALFSSLSAGFSVYIISQHPSQPLFMTLPILTLIPALNYSYHYGSNPNLHNQKGIENSAIMMFVACMLSLILGT